MNTEVNVSKEIVGMQKECADACCDAINRAID